MTVLLIPHLIYNKLLRYNDSKNFIKGGKEDEESYDEELTEESEEEN